MNQNQSQTNTLIEALSEAVESATDESVKDIHSIDADSTENKNFIVTTNSSTYFLKMYSAGSISERDFELNVLNKLLNDGLTFSIHAISKPFIVMGRPAMLFDTIDGSTFDPDIHTSDKHIATIAKQLAQMHTSLMAFDAGQKTRFDALGFEFVDTFQLETSDATIIKALGILREAFVGINTNELETTIIHDDLSPHNVMLSHTGELRFIDFDDAHHSYRISDIGTVIKEFIVGPNKNIDEDKIKLFIHHYESVRTTAPLTRQEKLLLNPMILRRALFMYAYYSMVEKERHIYLQSNDEYCIVAALTNTD